jgi:hypothetical protein
VALRDGTAWRFEGREGAADPTAWLSDLRALKAQRWARPDEAAAAEALAKPDFVVRVTLEGRGEAELVAGPVFDEDGQQLRWARWGGALAGEAFLVTDYMLKRLAVTSDALRETRLFGGQALDKVALTVGDEARWAALRGPGGWGLEGLSAAEQVKAAAVSELIDGLTAAKALTFEDAAWEKASEGVDAASQGVLSFTDASGRAGALRYALPAEGDPKVTLDAGPLSGQVVTVARAALEGWLKVRTDLVEAAPAPAPTPAPGPAAAQPAPAPESPPAKAP